MGKSKRFRHHKPIDVGPPPSETGFSKALISVAVAQICQSVGYKGAQNAALTALTDIAARYLQAAAKSAAACANRHGRTESNLPDIIVALEELEWDRGFYGASDVRSYSVFDSGVLVDVMRFVRRRKEVPFAQTLPPMKREGELWNGVEKGRPYEEGGRLRHAPRWLPPIPALEAVEKGEGREREAMWGCLSGDVGKERDKFPIGVCAEGEMEGNKRGGIEMGEKRGKVRFKIGGAAAAAALGMGGVWSSKSVGNGVCRGGGFGKRVQCSAASSWSGENEIGP